MNTHASGSFADELARQLGAGAAPPPGLLARARNAFGSARFAALLAPDSADGVAAVLAACAREEWPVIALGAATWIMPTNPGATTNPGAAVDPDARPPVLLSTARLDRITEHEPADLVIGLQAGVPLQRVAESLAAERQWLPLDPPALPEATIGAAIAGADDGPLRAGHGTPRDMVLGVEIATGDGRLLRFGGRVVKNVAGYDGVRLAVGSRGKLGVITAAYLRVRGQPRADRTLAIACGPGSDGARRGAEMALAVRAVVACDALELISPAVAGAISGQPATAGWTLLVRMLGSDAAVSDGVDRVTRLAARADGVSGAVWEALARLESRAAMALRLTGPPTSLPDVVAAEMPDPFRDELASVAGEAESATGSSGGGWMIAAHAADGVVRLWRPVRARMDAAGAGGSTAAERAIEPDDTRPGVRDIAAQYGWALRCDRVPSGVAAGATERPGALAALEGRVRNVFDPAGIMRSGGATW